MSLYNYEVGQRRPELIRGGVAPRLSIDDSGLMLICAMERPTKREIQLFGSGNALDITAGRVDDVLVMTFQFGGREGYGCDVTYTPHLGLPPQLQPAAEGQGYAVQMMLVDGHGTILRIRLVGLSTVMSRYIRETTLDIASKQFDREAFEHSIRKIYQWYTPYELRRKAACKFTATEAQDRNNANEASNGATDGSSVSPSPFDHNVASDSPDYLARYKHVLRKCKMLGLDRVETGAYIQKLGLPKELSHLYTLPCDCGHSIMAIPACLEEKAKDHPDLYVVPMPIRLVLERGWRRPRWEAPANCDDYVIVDCEYDSELGLRYDEHYEDY